MGSFQMQQYKTYTKILSLWLQNEIKKVTAARQAQLIKLSQNPQLQQADIMAFQIQSADYVRQAKKINAYQLLDVYIQQIQSDLELMRRAYPGIPETLVQPLSHLFFTSKYFGIPELTKILEQIMKDYGKKIYNQLMEECDSKSDPLFKEIVSYHQVSDIELQQVKAEVTEYQKRMWEKTSNYKSMKKQEEQQKEQQNAQVESKQDEPLDSMEALRRRLDNL